MRERVGLAARGARRVECRASREWIGAGVPPGLQSRSGFARAGPVGSIPMHSRQSNVHDPSATSTVLAFSDYRAGDEREIVQEGGEDALVAWRHRHLEAPAGHRVLVARGPDERVVGHVAALGQHVQVGGERVTFAHVTGAHVRSAAVRASTAARGLARCGALARLGEAWIERNLRGRDALAWCAPRSIRAWRFAKFSAGFAVIRTHDRLAVDAAAPRIGAAPGIDVTESTHAPEDVDDLFERAAAHMRMVQVRDRSFFDWRFAGAAYTFGAARRAGRTTGLAVFRAGTFAGEEAGIACEWLVDPSDEGARAALLAWLSERTVAAGRARLVTALADSNQEWLALQRLGLRAEPTDVFVAGVESGRGFDMRKVYHEWYWTLADSDLV
jgi:hypothetical protein